MLNFWFSLDFFKNNVTTSSIIAQNFVLDRSTDILVCEASSDTDKNVCATEAGRF